MFNFTSIKEQLFKINNPAKKIITMKESDFLNENVVKQITTFSSFDSTRGYKKILHFFDNNRHAEALILVKPKMPNQKPTLICFNKETLDLPNNQSINSVTDRKKIQKHFNIIYNNVKKNPLVTHGCIEYALAVLQDFDGTVHKKTSKGLAKVNVNQIQQGDTFITERQAKLYQSTKTLEEVGIDTKTFIVKNSNNQKMNLEKYTKSYQDETGKNKHLNVLTCISRERELGSYKLPDINSGRCYSAKIKKDFCNAVEEYGKLEKGLKAEIKKNNSCDINQIQEYAGLLKNTFFNLNYFFPNTEKREKYTEQLKQSIKLPPIDKPNKFAISK